MYVCVPMWHIHTRVHACFRVASCRALLLLLLLLLRDCCGMLCSCLLSPSDQLSCFQCLHKSIPGPVCHPLRHTSQRHRHPHCKQCHPIGRILGQQCRLVPSGRGGLRDSRSCPYPRVCSPCRTAAPPRNSQPENTDKRRALPRQRIGKPRSRPSLWSATLAGCSGRPARRVCLEYTHPPLHPCRRTASPMPTCRSPHGLF